MTFCKELKFNLLQITSMVGYETSHKQGLHIAFDAYM